MTERHRPALAIVKDEAAGRTELISEQTQMILDVGKVERVTREDGTSILTVVANPADIAAAALQQQQNVGERNEQGWAECACCPCNGTRHATQNGEFWDRCYIEHQHGCDGRHGKRDSCNRDAGTSPMRGTTAAAYVAQAAELLGQHDLAQRYTVLDDVCRCGTTVKDHGTHLAEVLAAAGLLPTGTAWGVRYSQGVVVEPTERSARVRVRQAARDSLGPTALVFAPAHDWKDATDD